MSVHPVLDLAAYLHGTWQVVRHLETTTGAPLGRFEGTATFTAVTAGRDGELAYAERGVAHLRSARRPLDASRRLHYLVEGTRAEVRFDDGRRFHDLDLRTGRWDSRHDCGDDRYVVLVEVRDRDRFEQTWRVRGPGKAYVSRTTFGRVPVHGAPTPSPDLGEQVVEA